MLNNSSPVDGAIIPGALKLRDAARYCSVSPVQIIRWIKLGYLSPNRASRHMLFPRKQLDDFLSDPRFATRHTKLPPQSLPGAQQWRKAVAARKRKARRAA